jgi:hypothetical protein
MVLITLAHKKFLVMKPHTKKGNGRGYVRWPRFFKNCRAMEGEKKEKGH